jgi:hypothetical protein
MSFSTAVFACISQVVSIFSVAGGIVTACGRNANHTTQAFKTHW